MDTQLWSEVPDLARDFPRLPTSSARKTSPIAPGYNCIAWAAGDPRHFWWPVHTKGAFWPVGVSRKLTLQAFIDAFRTKGYAPCTDGAFESGFEKVAIFIGPGGTPTHAAKQIVALGKWSSKLGRGVDIEHDLNDLDGPLYGVPTQFLKRTHRPPAPPTPAAPAAPAAPLPS